MVAASMFIVFFLCMIVICYEYCCLLYLYITDILLFIVLVYNLYTCRLVALALYYLDSIQPAELPW